MYGRMNSSSIIFAIVFVGVFIYFSMFMMVRQGTIVINLPDQLALSECNVNLNKCTELKTPQCAPIECKCGSQGIFFTTIGAIFGLVGYGLYFYALYKAKKINTPNPKSAEDEKKC